MLATPLLTNLRADSTRRFRSAFRDPNVYKNMITMPMPHILHLYCMEHYATYGTVCSQMSNSENGADSRAKHFRKWDKLKVSE